MEKTIPHIMAPSDGYSIWYDKAIQYEDLQQDFGWTAKEIAVEDDINDLIVHSTEAERHGILETLRLFTHYELFAGEEFWGGKFQRMFPRVEFQRMGAEFARTELCIHAPFYHKIDEVLYLNTPEFYNSWKHDPVLRDRMSFIGKYINSDDFGGILSLAVFSMVEGAILYSSFAFLKSFKKQGRNMIPNIVSGINFSVRDEGLHSEAGAWVASEAIKQYVKANDDLGIMHDYTSSVLEAADTLRKHEFAIIDKIFEKGPIDGITPFQMKEFVTHRVNVCLEQLGVPSAYPVEDTSIQKWFYDDVAGIRYTDQFATMSSNYSRNWSEGAFRW